MVNVDSLIYCLEKDSGKTIKRLSDDTFRLGRRTIIVRTKTIFINKKKLSFNGTATDAMRVLEVTIWQRGWYFYHLNLHSK
jgi:hypothetical protein